VAVERSCSVVDEVLETMVLDRQSLQATMRMWKWWMTMKCEVYHLKLHHLQRSVHDWQATNRPSQAMQSVDFSAFAIAT
jgi:hypothetical protein